MTFDDEPSTTAAPCESPRCTPAIASPWEATAEHEILAGLLTYSQSPASALDLLKHFWSIGHVLSAEPRRLTALGLTARDVALFGLIRETARRLVKGKLCDRPTLQNWDALTSYLQMIMAYEPVEVLRVLFLDRKNHLIADEVQQRGTVDHTPVYPREVARRALILNASAVIAVHNHPSGDPKPSRDDIEMTRSLRQALDPLGIVLHDHLVIGHGKHASFRALGLL